MAFDLNSIQEDSGGGKFDLNSIQPDSVNNVEAPSIAGNALKTAMTSIASKGIDPFKLSQGPLLSMAEKVASNAYATAKEQLFESPVVKEFNQQFSDKKAQVEQLKTQSLLPTDLGSKVAVNALSNLSQRDVAKGIESVGVDTVAFALAGSGVKVKDLASDFLKTKPFASTNQLFDDLFKLNHTILKETSSVLQKKASNEAVKETAKIITKSNNPVEAKIKIDAVVKNIFDERNSLLAEHNTPVNIRHTKALENYLSSNDSFKELTGAQRNSALKLLEEAQSEIATFGGKIDRLTAQKLKEKYQDLAQYERSPDAHIRGTAIAARKVASSLREMVVDKLPKAVAKKVQSANDRYSGLKESLDIFTTLEAQFKVNPAKFSSGIHNYFSQIAGRPSFGSQVAAAVRFAPKIIGRGSFRSETANIEKLKNQYLATKSIIENRLKQSMSSSDIGQRVLASDMITQKLLSNKLFDQKLLPASEVKSSTLQLTDRSKEFVLKDSPEQIAIKQEMSSRIKDTFAKARTEISKKPVKKLKYISKKGEK